jgi:demethylmenaquinone methyltransferase/2-methoxy-6-polyprenyl-1,4-benzoquinol methylase
MSHFVRGRDAGVDGAERQAPAVDGAETRAPVVQAMFGRIAPRYDVLNHLLSFGLDFHWWRAMAKALGAGGGALALDVAAGTGDSSLAIARRGARVGACDFTLRMLAAGAEKFRRAPGLGHGLAPDLVPSPVGADARALPFRDSCFDGVAISYGIRNVEDRPSAYREFLRVLRPGGRLAVLEFSRPARAWLRWACGAYGRLLLPAVGRLVSGDAEAYRYLPETIKNFPAQGELARELWGAGFADVGHRNLSGGIVALHTGTKPM